MNNVQSFFSSNFAFVSDHKNNLLGPTNKSWLSNLDHTESMVSIPVRDEYLKSDTLEKLWMYVID